MDPQEEGVMIGKAVVVVIEIGFIYRGMGHHRCLCDTQVLQVLPSYR